MNEIKTIKSEFLGSSLNKPYKKLDTTMLSNLDNIIILYVYNVGNEYIVFKTLRELIVYFEKTDNVTTLHNSFENVADVESYLLNFEII